MRKEGVFDHVVIDFRGFRSMQVQPPASRRYFEYSTPTANPELLIRGMFRTEVVSKFRRGSMMDHLRMFGVSSLKEGYVFPLDN